MIKLNANPQAVAALLGFLEGTPDQIAFLQGVIQTHGANPADFYVNNPPMDLSYEQMQQLPAFQSQDWSRFAHPYVIAQLLVDLCEKASQPLPDNLHVAVDGEWKPLSYVQPTYVAPRPVTIPAAAPLLSVSHAPAPEAIVVQHDPYPQPQAVPMTPPAPTTLQLQPEAEILDAEFGDALVTREVLNAQVTMPAQTAQQIDQARAVRSSPELAIGRGQPEPAGFQQATTLAPGPTPQAQPAAPQNAAQQPTQAVAMPAQESPAVAPAPTIAGAGQFGLPQPFMTASKGTSVFDKDPGGEPPKGASPRQVRDIMAMMPHFFAAQAGDVVGKGTGSVQRHRLYTAATLLLHTALSSVPDKNCSVGYLLWHLEHLRYNASQSPGGQTMLTYEQWLYRDGGE